MEDDLIFFLKEDDLNFFLNGRRTHKKQCNPNQLKVKTIFLKIEDDLNIFENGRRPIYF
jgi:hypothetical protein